MVGLRNRDGPHCFRSGSFTGKSLPIQTTLWEQHLSPRGAAKDRDVYLGFSDHECLQAFGQPRVKTESRSYNRGRSVLAASELRSRKSGKPDSSSAPIRRMS
jgi:hypothetical protein